MKSKKHIALTAAVLALIALTTGCQETPSAASNDTAELRAQIQELTEDLYWIHLRLDTARSSLEEADTALDSGNASAAAYQISEAHRVVKMADDKVLDMGQQLQTSFGLDKQ